MLMIAVASLMMLSACGGNEVTPASSTPTTENSSSTGLKEFEGLSFADQNVVYDGAKHSLSVGNLPEGANVTYSGQDYVNAGTYPITAVVKKTGYVDKTLKATLTIAEADLTAEKVASLGISFKDASYPYDAESHSLQITGDVPTGTNVTYKIGDHEGNSASEVGEYTVTCTLKMPNYHPYTLSAKLTIVAVEKTLYSSVVGSTVLFQNDLDNDTLYAYNTALKKVSYDVMGGFSEVSGLSFGLVKSLYGKAVVTYQEDGQGGIKKTKVLAGVGVDLLAAVDQTHFYYSVHNLLANKDDNGIYLYDTAQADDDYRGAKVVSDDYARDMVVANGILYYVNADRDIVSLSGSTKTTYLVNGNIYELTAKDGYLYYNKGNVVAKGLYRLNLANKTESKLTVDNGKNLSIIGNALYYVNKDVVATSLFGKGIYRIPLDGTFADTSGTKIVDGADDKIGSLASDGTSLFYYRFNTAHFYKNSVNGANEIDLMASFVKAEDTLLYGGAANCYDNQQIYFANLKDEGCLYKYDLTTHNSFKVLAYSVNNVYVHEGYLYFGSYLLTNYAEWRMNLTSKVISKISSDRCESLRFVGDKIYYLNVGASKATLHVMGLDGTNDTEIASDGMDPFSLEVMSGKAYLVRDPAVGYKKLAVVDLSSNKVTLTSEKCISLVQGAANTLYLNDDSDKSLTVYDAATSTKTSSVGLSTKLSDLAYVNGKLYAQDVTNAKLLIYQDGALTSLASVSPSGMVGDGTSLYFVSAQTGFVNNYPATTYVKETSNGCLYSYTSSLNKLLDI